MIVIPEKDLVKEFGWFRGGMGELAVRTYLIKYPQIIQEGLSLHNFLGLGVWFKNTHEADMVFRKDGVYYIIETKQKRKYSKGWDYLKGEVVSFEADLKEHGEKCQEIVAVLATTHPNYDKLTVENFPWFDEVQ